MEYYCPDPTYWMNNDLQTHGCHMFLYDPFERIKV